MIQRLTLLILAVLALTGAAPQANLLVELRWVDTGVSGAALAGAREGAVVLGTAGSISNKPGGRTLSTRRDNAEIQQQPLLVLNGRSASLLLKEDQPVQMLDFVVQRADGPAPQVSAVVRNRVQERQRGFVVTPTWPGGKQPVTVELKALTAEQELLSTVQVALGDWITVARSGSPAARPEPGVISSRDAEPQPQRELQLRVKLAP